MKRISFLRNEPDIKYAPLQISQYKETDNSTNHDSVSINIDHVGHQHTRNEILNLTQPSGVGTIVPKEFFEKAKSFVSYSSEYKKIVGEKGKNSKKAKKYLERHGNVVGVIGHAGVGKTTLTEIMLQDMLSDKHLYNTDFLFYVQLRDVDSAKKVNLLEFLIGSSSYKSCKWMHEKNRRDAVLDFLCDSGSVCVILDGLDEISLDIHTDQKHKKLNFEIHSEKLPHHFIFGFLTGRIFPRAKAVITSRPRQMADLPTLYKPQFIVKVLGIDVEGQKQICENICGAAKDQIFRDIQRHPNLSSFCFTPLNCILVCYCLYRYSLDKKKKYKPPTNITDVLVSTLGLFIDTDNAHKMLEWKNLSELAWTGIKKRKLYFDDDDLSNAGLTRSDNEDFITTFQKEDESYPFISLKVVKKNYSYFSHKILQEFFAAIHLAFVEKPKGFEKQFFGTTPLNLNSSHLEIVTRFLFGLCNPNNLLKLKAIKPKQENFYLPAQLIDKLKDFVRFTVKETAEKIKNSLDRFQTYLRICSWIYELNDPEFIEEISNLFPDLLVMSGDFLPGDAIPFCHVIRARKKPLTVNIFSTFFIGNALPRFLKEFETNFVDHQNSEKKPLIEVNFLQKRCFSSFEM